ncbi:MAG: SAM-dependent chlorinase/fluorinase [Desulfobacteraceae bacterium]|nr:SAM-dependent chlorinase/fluorinase [Desulfobacteraceae bacterium]
MPAKIITLLTDFGTADGYAAAMKGVILGICPEARLVDVTHLVPPQDVRAGGFILAGVHSFYPEGTVHVAVVDPGVGTERRAVAVRTSRSFLVGPDNGLFSWILKQEGFLEARLLENRDLWRREVSRTFHGRDIFAPVAAHLACGIPFESVGPLCSPLVADWASVTRTETEMRGEIIHVDRFGNAVSNITREDMSAFAPDGPCIFRIGPHTIQGISDTYGHVPPGQPLALIGSTGHVEIAVNLGNASAVLAIRTGEPLTVTRPGD